MNVKNRLIDVRNSIAYKYEQTLISIFGNFYDNGVKYTFPVFLIGIIIGFSSSLFAGFITLGLFLWYIHILYRSEYRWRDHTRDTGYIYKYLNNIPTFDTEDKIGKVNNE